MNYKDLITHFTPEMSKLFALVAIDLDDEKPGIWQQSKTDINKGALETLISWNLVYRDYLDTTDEMEALGLTARGLRLAEWARDHNDGWLKGSTLLKEQKNECNHNWVMEGHNAGDPICSKCYSRE